MYIHIGNNYMLNDKNIIGIFNIDSLKKEIKNLVEDKYLIDISEGKKKSFILVKENDILKAYISNISSTTLAKRK